MVALSDHLINIILWFPHLLIRLTSILIYSFYLDGFFLSLFLINLGLVFMTDLYISSFYVLVLIYWVVFSGYKLLYNLTMNLKGYMRSHHEAVRQVRQALIGHIYSFSSVPPVARQTSAPLPLLVFCLRLSLLVAVLAPSLASQAHRLPSSSSLPALTQVSRCSFSPGILWAGRRYTRL